MRLSLAALAAVLVVAPRAGAQTLACRDAGDLAGATSRGRALAAYDRAAWHGTDAVMALRPADGAFRQYVAQLGPDGWVVSFGRLDPDRDVFLVSYEAVPAGAPGAFTGRAVSPAREESGMLPAAVRAINTAGAAFGRPTRPYNMAVLPTGGGEWWVYAVPAPTQVGVWPLGADARYRVSGDGRRVLEVRRLHRSVLESKPQAQQAPDGRELVAGFHSHVLRSEVEDTDVFTVLAREPRVPEYIVSDEYVFRVDTAGTATCIGPREAVLAR